MLISIIFVLDAIWLSFNWLLFEIHFLLPLDGFSLLLCGSSLLFHWRLLSFDLSTLSFMLLRFHLLSVLIAAVSPILLLLHVLFLLFYRHLNESHRGSIFRIALSLINMVCLYISTADSQYRIAVSLFVFDVNWCYCCYIHLHCYFHVIIALPMRLHWFLLFVQGFLLRLHGFSWINIATSSGFIAVWFICIVALYRHFIDLYCCVID